MDRYWRRLRLGIIVGDALAVLAAYLIAAGARFGFVELGVTGDLWPVYPVLALGVSVLTIGLGWQHGTYRHWALFGTHRVYPLLVTVATYGVVAVIILSYFVDDGPLVSRSWLMTSWGCSAVALSLSRLFWRQVAVRWRRKGILVRKLLIAGANQQGIAVAQQLDSPTEHGTKVVGFLDDYQRPGTEVINRIRVLGHPGSVLEQAKAVGADEVIIIAGALAWESQRLLAEMVTRPGCPIEARISPTFYDLLTTSAELSEVAYVPLLTLHRTRIAGANSFTKEFLDRTSALVILTAFIPLFVYWRIKAWILGVPMLDHQQVVGVEGRRFEVVGLGPGVAGSPVFARLPALWNVFRQDLSLVGPRPVRAAELEEHQPWLANLFAMRPGITGLWRLRGGARSIEERVALDLYYVRNYSLALDLEILMDTARELGRRTMGQADGLARWESLDGPIPAEIATDGSRLPVASTDDGVERSRRDLFSESETSR